MGCFSCFASPKRALKIKDIDRAPSFRSASESSRGKELAIDDETSSGDGSRGNPKSGGSSGHSKSPAKSFTYRKELAIDDETSSGDGSRGNPKSGGSSGHSKSPAKSFTYRELSAATDLFKDANMIGEGGFGKVFKGRLNSGEVVAIKQLNPEGNQGSQEFINEVLMLSLLDHANLMNLIGYCTDGDERLLVYQYMPKGSLEDHLFDWGPNSTPLDWNTRMKIAVGTGRGLEYLHNRVHPSVIFRDLKAANILLDNDFHAKLSDFGLARLGPVGDNTHVSTRVMGTHGYCAPEYLLSGKLTVKSDVFSLGVVLLELLTGRRAIDPNRARGEQNLVSWCRPFFKDRRRFSRLADPAMQGQYPVRSFEHAIGITAMCLHELPAHRPLMHDVLVALEYVANQPYNPNTAGSAARRRPDPRRDRHRSF